MNIARFNTTCTVRRPTGKDRRTGSPTAEIIIPDVVCTPTVSHTLSGDDQRQGGVIYIAALDIEASAAVYGHDGFELKSHDTVTLSSDGLEWEVVSLSRYRGGNFAAVDEVVIAR